MLRKLFITVGRKYKVSVGMEVGATISKEGSWMPVQEVYGGEFMGGAGEGWQGCAQS